MPVGKCYWKNISCTKNVLEENYFPSIEGIKIFKHTANLKIFTLNLYRLTNMLLWTCYYNYHILIHLFIPPSIKLCYLWYLSKEIVIIIPSPKDISIHSINDDLVNDNCIWVMIIWLQFFSFDSRFAQCNTQKFYVFTSFWKLSTSV